MLVTVNYCTLIITEDEANMRLDKILAARYSLYSRTYFQYLIENQFVLLNSHAVKKRVSPKEGDTVTIHFILSPEIELVAQDIALDILYEDEHLLAINKPAGMVVHPAVGHPSGTFVNALLFHCKNITCPVDSLRPGIVHRLDKETSGVLLAAKHMHVQGKLAELFAMRQIHKRYLAICYGMPPEGWIDLPLARHESKRKLRGVHPEGKEAQTHISVLQREGEMSFVCAEPKTGRTHQIRVHLQAKHAPILGDAAYGNIAINKKYNALRHMLHAHSIRFLHPITQEQIEITAPLPADMMGYMQRLFPHRFTEVAI